MFLAIPTQITHHVPYICQMESQYYFCKHETSERNTYEKIQLDILIVMFQSQSFTHNAAQTFIHILSVSLSIFHTHMHLPVQVFLSYCNQLRVVSYDKN